MSFWHFDNRTFGYRGTSVFGIFTMLTMFAYLTSFSKMIVKYWFANCYLISNIRYSSLNHFLQIHKIRSAKIRKPHIIILKQPIQQKWWFWNNTFELLTSTLVEVNDKVSVLVCTKHSHDSKIASQHHYADQGPNSSTLLCKLKKL